MARRKGCLILLAVVGGLVFGLALFYGPVIAAFARQGFFDRLPDKEQYSATREGNLKALYTAMMLYHDSEEKFPEANGWMDAIEPRLSTNDLKPGEAAKKLIRPGVASGFGYAINASAAGKYKDDVEGDPATTPLIMESEDTSRNASGPADPKALAISVSGQLIKP